MKHQWQPLKDGVTPDSFAYDVDPYEGPGHNGPRCTVCGFFFCEHCWPEGWGQGCPGSAPDGFEYDWCGSGSTREPELPELYPIAGIR